MKTAGNQVFRDNLYMFISLPETQYLVSFFLILEQTQHNISL